MLEGLDEVPWASVNHAYGPAIDVPDLLRALVRAGDEREKALRALFGNIIHQGTVWQATPLAVPFLLEIATGPLVERRFEVVPLLTALAMGNGTGAVVPEGESPDAPGRLTRNAVRAGVPGIRAFLDDSDARVRIIAAMFLRGLHEDAPAIVPALARRAGSEVESEPLCVVAIALGEHAGSPLAAANDAPRAMRDARDSALAALSRIASAEDPLVKFAAALGAVAAEGPAAPAEMVAILRDVVRDPREIEEAWSGLPFDSSLITWAAGALMRLGRAQVATLAPEICGALDRVDALSSMELVQILLWALLGEGGEKPRTRESIAPEALVTLRAIFASEKPWIFNANMGGILRGWGLPSFKEAFGKFVA